MKPPIRIVVPHYNQSRFLEAALRSIVLNNGYDGPVRVTVVDDGSSPGEAIDAKKIAEKLGVEWLAHLENKGTAAAINTGQSFPEGGFVTWCSSDNVYPEGWLGKLAEAMDEDAGAVIGDYTWQRPGGSPRYIGRDYDPEYLINNPQDCYCGPAFLIRSEVWRLAGPHIGKNAHDYGHWLRVEEACWARGYSIRRVEQSLCFYNAHPERATDTRRGPEWEDARSHQDLAVKRRREAYRLAVLTPIGDGHEVHAKRAAASVKAFQRSLCRRDIWVDHLMLRDQGEGRSATRNRLLGMASEADPTHVMWLDADDTLSHTFGMAMIEALEEHPGEVCFGMIETQRMAEPKELRDGQTGSGYFSKKELLDLEPWRVCNVGYIAPFEIQKGIAWNESLHTGEDYDMFLRLSEATSLFKLSRPLITNIRGQHSTGPHKRGGGDWREAVAAIKAEWLEKAE